MKERPRLEKNKYILLVPNTNYSINLSSINAAISISIKTLITPVHTQVSNKGISYSKYVIGKNRYLPIPMSLAALPTDRQ